MPDINIIIKKEEDSLLQQMLKRKEEEAKHMQTMTMLQEMLSKLERLPKSGSFHSGGG